MGDRMLSLRRFWTVIVSCLYVLVVLFVFSRLNQRPEAIVVAVLGLTYVAIRTHAIGQVVFDARAFVRIHEQLFYLRNLLGDPHVDSVYADFKRTGGAAESAVYAKIYLESFFLFMIFLICLFVLFTSLPST
jgi:hypothetical protein